MIEESAGDTTVYYIREPGGELIARVHPTQGIRYYHFDELGSTRLLTDADGTVTDRYAYDAYGSLLSRDRYTGSVDQPYQYVGQSGYYTHYQEPEFGLIQLGVRFYDTEVGRFTQVDPVPSDSTNSYCYVDGSPTEVIDPSGRGVQRPGGDDDIYKRLDELDKKGCDLKNIRKTIEREFGDHDPKWKQKLKQWEKWRNHRKCRPSKDKKCKPKRCSCPIPTPQPVRRPSVVTVIIGGIIILFRAAIECLKTCPVVP